MTGKIPNLPFFLHQRRLNRELLKAIKLGATEKVSRLLDLGADANTNDGFISALGLAGRWPDCNAAIVALLLNQGADVNGGSGGRIVNPFLVAAHLSDDDRIRLLIEAGAKVDALDSRGPGNTPLQELVAWASLETITLLLDRGADVNQKNIGNVSIALHNASQWGRLDVVKLLLTRGADLNATDGNGKTALDTAKEMLAHPSFQNDPKRPWALRLRETIAFLESIRG